MTTGNPEVVKVNHPGIEGEVLIINREDYTKEKYGDVLTGRKPVKEEKCEDVDELTPDNISEVNPEDIIAIIAAEYDSENEDDRATVKALFDVESSGTGRQVIIDLFDDFLNG